MKFEDVDIKLISSSLRLWSPEMEWIKLLKKTRPSATSPGHAFSSPEDRSKELQPRVDRRSDDQSFRQPGKRAWNRPLRLRSWWVRGCLRLESNSRLSGSGQLAQLAAAREVASYHVGSQSLLQKPCNPKSLCVRALQSNNLPQLVES